MDAKLVDEFVVSCHHYLQLLDHQLHCMVKTNDLLEIRIIRQLAMMSIDYSSENTLFLLPIPLYKRQFRTFVERMPFYFSQSSRQILGIQLEVLEWNKTSDPSLYIQSHFSSFFANHATILIK
jgi:hypothetical protein